MVWRPQQHAGLAGVDPQRGPDAGDGAEHRPAAAVRLPSHRIAGGPARRALQRFGQGLAGQGGEVEFDDPCCAQRVAVQNERPVRSLDPQRAVDERSQRRTRQHPGQQAGHTGPRTGERHGEADLFATGDPGDGHAHQQRIEGKEEGAGQSEASSASCRGECKRKHAGKLDECW